MTDKAPSIDEPLGESAGALDRIFLRFHDPETEAEYQKQTMLQSLDYTRLYVGAGVLCFVIFGILDILVLPPEALPTITVIRFGIATPLLLLILAATYLPRFADFTQSALAAAMLVSGGGVIAMTATLPTPYASMYYAGVILVVAYCGSLLRMKFAYLVACSLGLFAAYQMVALSINPVSHATYLINTFFLAMATGVGIFTGYLHELFTRKAFLAEATIRAQNESRRVLLMETRAASKAKSEFLATMSHELRTPLNAICGFSEIIEGEMFGPAGCPQYVDYARDIHDSGTHLLSIINEILDIAKAEAGKLTLSEEAFDLTETVLAAVRMVNAATESKNLDVLLEGTEDAMFVCADERLLRQAILNLLSNAIKFTDPGGRVKIAILVHVSGDVSVEIVDTGVGIAPSDLPRVVRPFEQVEGAMAREHGGTGLGLPYSEKIAEIHGGRLTLESALGLGTRCRIILPKWRLLETTRDNEMREAC